MTTKHQVHNLIILDESGSMEPIKKTIIQGFNEIVQTIKGIEIQFPEQAHFISLLTFNGVGFKVLHYIDAVSKLKQIDETRYKPDASTPLYDAIGFGVNKLHQFLEGQANNYTVLVTILTDGQENASREFQQKDIRLLIERLKQNRWTFTYIGTDHDVEKVAHSLSIDNNMHFYKNEEDIKKMFGKEKAAREIFSHKINLKEDTNADFYKPAKPKK